MREMGEGLLATNGQGGYMKGPFSSMVLSLAHSCRMPPPMEGVGFFLASGLQVRKSIGRVPSCPRWEGLYS